MFYEECLTYDIFSSRVDRKTNPNSFNAKGGIREITVKNRKAEKWKKSLSEKSEIFYFYLSDSALQSEDIEKQLKKR